MIQVFDVHLRPFSTLKTDPVESRSGQVDKEAAEAELKKKEEAVQVDCFPGFNDRWLVTELEGFAPNALSRAAHVGSASGPSGRGTGAEGGGGTQGAPVGGRRLRASAVRKFKPWRW